MEEVDAIKSVDAKMSALDEDARVRVLAWLNMKFGEAQPASVPSGVTPGRPEDSPRKPRRAKKKGAKTKKAAGKTKTKIRVIKDLNLKPKGKTSARDFANEKSPTNHKEKCTIAVYYLEKKAGIDAITTAHVYTFYKEMSWVVPANLNNMLAQTGSEGWLDTSDSEKIEVTTMGGSS